MWITTPAEPALILMHVCRSTPAAIRFPVVSVPVDAPTLAVLLAAASAAGWVDAVVGGGGLILIPVLMLVFPGMAPATALGTNKLTALSGTASAAIRLFPEHL